MASKVGTLVGVEGGKEGLVLCLLSCCAVTAGGMAATHGTMWCDHSVGWRCGHGQQWSAGVHLLLSLCRVLLWEGWHGR